VSDWVTPTAYEDYVPYLICLALLCATASAVTVAVAFKDLNDEKNEKAKSDPRVYRIGWGIVVPAAMAMIIICINGVTGMGLPIAALAFVAAFLVLRQKVLSRVPAPKEDLADIPEKIVSARSGLLCGVRVGLRTAIYQSDCPSRVWPAGDAATQHFVQYAWAATTDHRLQFIISRQKSPVDPRDSPLQRITLPESLGHCRAATSDPVAADRFLHTNAETIRQLVEWACMLSLNLPRDVFAPPEPLDVENKDYDLSVAGVEHHPNDLPKSGVLVAVRDAVAEDSHDVTMRAMELLAALSKAIEHA
jgi:hypothetical protein